MTTVILFQGIKESLKKIWSIFLRNSNENFQEHQQVDKAVINLKFFVNRNCFI